MLAARLYGPRDLRIETVPESRAPGVGEVLIDVTAVGVCGSDLHTYADGRIGSTQVDSPLVLGHEQVGRVVAVGEGAVAVDGTPLVPGQRVVWSLTVSCGRCATRTSTTWSTPRSAASTDPR